MEEQGDREEDRGHRRRPGGDEQRYLAAAAERLGEVLEEVEREAREDGEEDHHPRLPEAARAQGEGGADQHHRRVERRLGELALEEQAVAEALPFMDDADFEHISVSRIGGGVAFVARVERFEKFARATNSPSESGPRWTMRSHIECRSSFAPSGWRVNESRLAQPVMPHIVVNR